MQRTSKVIKISRRCFQALVYVIIPITIFVQMWWVYGVAYLILLLTLDFVVGALAYSHEKGIDKRK